MRIGFDISQTGKAKAGCGWLADSLIRHLAEIDTRNEYVLYPTFGDGYWDIVGPESTVHVDKPNFQRGLSHATMAEMREFWRNPPSDLETRLGEPDIVHANNFFCPRGLRQARLVYTLYDMMFLEHPESTTEANRNVCFTGVFNASLRADFIVAISQYSRNHFLDTFPHYPPDRVRVVHPGSRFHFQPQCPQPRRLADLLPGRFWLNVGTIEPRKNHRRLLLAYARLKKKSGGAFPLVLAGGKGWLMEEFGKFIEELGLQQDVIFLGYVEDTELQWLYQNCFAFLYPSLYEGFGLPVLEAMTLGAPVITSNRTSLPEVVGADGLLVDPLQEEEISQAMLKLSTDPALRVALGDRSRNRAKQFSWARTANEVLKVYEQVLEKQRYRATPGNIQSSMEGRRAVTA